MSVNLLIGASSGIALAIINALRQASESVIAVSRQPISDSASVNQSYTCDYSEEAVAACCADIFKKHHALSRIIICNGILHDENFTPEKRIEDFNWQQFLQSQQVNAFTPLLWLKHLSSGFNKQSQTKIAVFNARVGSINDNRLGGWYSYRSSKAAQNMLLKSLSIEYQRRFPNIKLFSFHPGTTDTALSKPFQNNISPDKIFKPDFVAKRLLSIMDTGQADGELSYLDWDNKAIAW